MVFSVVMLFLFSFQVASPVAFAQEPSMITIPVTITPTPSQTISYTLPFPGMLPDNPFYFLKSLRDNVIGWLISDNLKKAQFDLLQADKRLESGVYLIQESKSETPLALSTISKGENYMSESIVKAQQAALTDSNANDVVQQLRTATRKHAEVLAGLSTTVPSSQKSTLQALQQRVNDLIKQADAIKLKK